MPIQAPLQNLLKDQRCRQLPLQKRSLNTPPLPIRNPGPSLRGEGGGVRIKNGMAQFTDSIEKSKGLIQKSLKLADDEQLDKALYT